MGGVDARKLSAEDGRFAACHSSAAIASLPRELPVRVPTRPESITVNSNVAQGIVHLRVLQSTFMVVSAELTVILSETEIEGSCWRASVAARSSAG